MKPKISVPKLIGFCGYARVGKDTAAQEFAKLFPEREFEIIGYADDLKKDMEGCVSACAKLGVDVNSDKFKERFRPMWVLWSRVLKDIMESDLIWVERLRPSLVTLTQFGIIPAIKDVRYFYEVDEILNSGGVVIFIERKGYGPKNSEEDMSFSQIKDRYAYLMKSHTIHNDGSKTDLGQKVLKLLMDLGY